MNFPGAAAALAAFAQASTGDTVGEVEVMRRNSVCAACPKREKVTGIVSRVSQTLGVLANRHRVPKSMKDYRCGVCGCALMLLIPAKTPHKDSPEEAAVRPSSCWASDGAAPPVKSAPGGCSC
jgi:hypothetical protein